MFLEGPSQTRTNQGVTVRGLAVSYLLHRLVQITPLLARGQPAFVGDRVGTRPCSWKHPVPSFRNTLVVSAGLSLGMEAISGAKEDLGVTAPALLVSLMVWVRFLRGC